MKKTENDIIFSKTIKAGKRIYYLDVKENRKGELFLVITESKQVTINTGDKPEQAFEKHKIFLYREDFNNFFENLAQIVEYIEKNSPTSFERIRQIPNITQENTEKEQLQPETSDALDTPIKEINDSFPERWEDKSKTDV